MAEKPKQATPKTVRRVKNPETFRQRAIKAAEASDKPSRGGRIKGASTRVTRPVTRPVRKAAAVLGRQKPVRMLRRPARIIGKVLLPKYIRESFKELRLVTWPNFRQSLRLTFAVIVFAIIFGASIALIDYGLDKLFKNILLK